MAHQILVVEDDVPLTYTIRTLLTEANYQPIIAHTAEDGLKLAKENHPDLILLDVMVPNMGGWSLCRELRTFTVAPIIFLTALGDTQHIVQGLSLGADDYISKPFDSAEFLARIIAHLRRHTHTAGQRLAFGDGEIDINLATHIVQVRGKEVELTPREFSLLITLAKHAGRVIRAEELVSQAWEMDDPDAKRNLKPYIHYLRKKIERDPASPQWINTVRGVGYRFSEGV